MMLKSKRFIITLISGIVFIIGVFLFEQKPVEFATAIGIILTPYLTVETIKKSN